jgi:hypothetical protein
MLGGLNMKSGSALLCFDQHAGKLSKPQRTTHSRHNKALNDTTSSKTQRNAAARGDEHSATRYIHSDSDAHGYFNPLRPIPACLQHRLVKTIRADADGRR